ncbi:alanine-glyoxylate transaminase / serine-glyoxylate transaminase / serine-pyruvate transaminase [Poseidonocella pacifica]|uniref:Alanine-glyoxylate transaminase / serine-glyoxylate transaminase / serine-pyruvate transaminase n=1 Tax=Poseidonocella pacifica TaxID=871651 RepID=A0A1I0XH08_9RHOB|nr:aminotransferase class V-fold PLP-dependent enzyme [Poseidonocella pacifica]SFB00194.1 alanine-glyoxylate transaminase / serine-glyoxylate transaminase / serine-pyruvate transaminase [Poseidonocella pacifica]
MSLRHGRPYLAIPGPSVVPDRVLAAMHAPAPNIYEGALVDMVAGMIPELRQVARTAHHVAIYVSNGHGAWEAALSNVLSPGDRVLVLSTGQFAHGWAEVAQGVGAEVDILEFGKQAQVDPARVEAHLRADGDYRAVLVTHVDTSTSIRNDVGAVRKALDAAGYDGLLMADCIASLACDRFEMDAWGVDIMVAASQKGLMVPPGLGFVFFSPKAATVRAAMPRVSKYWDWIPRADPEFFYQYFGGTAPTHHLLGLRASLDMIAEEGIEAIWARHATLTRAIWAAVDAWGKEGPLELNVADPALRSHAVTALKIGAPYGTALREWVEREAGVTLGIGLGMAPPGDPEWHGFFRIGHMGHVNAHMILGMLGTIEAGLGALQIPHGAGGLSAAVQVISAAGTSPAQVEPGNTAMQKQCCE